MRRRLPAMHDDRARAGRAGQAGQAGQAGRSTEKKEGRRSLLTTTNALCRYPVKKQEARLNQGWKADLTAARVKPGTVVGGVAPRCIDASACCVKREYPYRVASSSFTGPLALPPCAAPTLVPRALGGMGGMLKAWKLDPRQRRSASGKVSATTCAASASEKACWGNTLPSTGPSSKSMNTVARPSSHGDAGQGMGMVRHAKV